MMRRVLTVMLVATATGACGGRELTLRSEPYPPNDLRRLARIFDPKLEPMGLRLVRGAVIDRGDGRYEPSDTGSHLALYVEPFGSVSTDRYISNIVPLTRVFVPEVFDRWTGLKTFDICQEPLAFVNDDPEPPPVSQVFVHRGPVSDLDWDAMDLEDLIRASRRYPHELAVILAPILRRSPRIKPLLEEEPSPSRGTID
jgi:hypothetical protein